MYKKYTCKVIHIIICTHTHSSFCATEFDVAPSRPILLILHAPHKRSEQAWSNLKINESRIDVFQIWENERFQNLELCQSLKSEASIPRLTNADITAKTYRWAPLTP